MTETIIEKVNKIQQDYDTVPYDSYPYEQSSVETLHTIGTLFGMNPPKIETARVLELGCAAGGNLIPHAMHHLKGSYVGVDLSKTQVDEGKKTIKELGLKNIELKCTSIADIDESFGKFDYIICHGVLSWVPELIQDKILEISKKNLNKNGIAYISYNTLPGWNMVRTIRDMMIYHTKLFPESDKVKQSRALLSFVKDSLEGLDTPYAKFLKNESDLLSGVGDYYLRHDHLEDHNEQFYFQDFAEKANKKGLQYLGDSSLASMYLGNMPKNVAEKFKEIKNIVRTEQYMDFINNRRFRSSLLCHNDVQLTRNLDINDIKKFTMSFDLIPEKPLSEIDLNSNDSLKFYYKGSKENNISTDSTPLKAILYVFSENKKHPISFSKLVNEANKLIGGNNKGLIEMELLKNGMNLVIKDYLKIYAIPRDDLKFDINKPNVGKLALNQASKNNWVTNKLHQAVALNFLEKIAIKYMDSKHTKENILDILLQESKKDNVVLNKDNKKITDLGEIKQELTKQLDFMIEKFRVNALFE